MALDLVVFAIKHILGLENAQTQEGTECVLPHLPPFYVKNMP